MTTPRILPNPILHLNAARAASGTGAGSNTVPTSEWFDLSLNGNHGTLTGFDYEEGDRPRTNSETDKAVWHDQSGNGNDGTLTGFGAWDGVTDGWTDDPALLFDGVDDYVNVADDATLQFGTGDFSFEFRTTFPITASFAYACVISKGMTTTPTAGTWGVRVSTSPSSTVSLRDSVLNGAYNAVVSTANLADGAHQVVFVRASGVYTMFVDGSLHGSPVTPSVTADLAAATVPVTIGRSAPGENRFVAIAPPLVRLYKGRALTPAEVAQNYAAGPTGTGYVRDGLVLDLNAARAVRPSGWVEL